MTMYFDTLFPKFISLNRDTCAHLFNDTEFIIFCPSKSKAEGENCLNEFIDYIRIPMNRRFYHAAELLGKGTESMKSIRKHSINWNVTEPYNHLQNQAEAVIKRIKLMWKSTMQRTGLSPRIGDYGLKNYAELLSWIAPKDGRPSLENLTGDIICLS